MANLNQEILIQALSELGVDTDNYTNAKSLAEKKQINLVDAFVQMELLNLTQSLEVVSKAYGVDSFSFSGKDLQTQAFKAMPEKIVRQHQVIGYVDGDSNVKVIMSDPSQENIIEDAQAVTGKEAIPVLASSAEIKKSISAIYDAQAEPSESEFDEFDADDESADDTKADFLFSSAEEDSEAPVVKVVQLILMDSLRKGASDIHIEPFENRVRVRYRIDGQLVESLKIPKKYHAALIARIKIISNLDITENRIPQDGRFKMKIGEKEVDYRVSILPVIWGGKIVMRSLDKSNLEIGLSHLGFTDVSMKHFETAIGQPFGMIVVTGPTGSGKSTTLYSILNELNTIERNIITVEDPIEYQVGGITQVQAKHEIGMTFSKALKAILRQSPDVVMIGEIRDSDTADIAVKASLTGQIVLSTLHTNDAAGAVVRLRDMGVDSFLISSSLTLVAAQRLCRQLCEHCKEKVDYSETELLTLGFDSTVAEYIKNPTYFKAKGCSRCGNGGYKGRVAITETMLIDDSMRSLIEKGEPSDVIKEHAIKNGMLTLRTDALLKFANGITTVDEVLRVTSTDE